MYVILILVAIAAVVVFGAWYAGLAKSKKMDVDQDAEQAQAAMAAWRRRQESEHLAQTGVSLRCLNCDHVFTGPMPDTGCPNCHIASLVVPADQAPSASAPLQTVGLSQSTEDANANRRQV